MSEVSWLAQNSQQERTKLDHRKTRQPESCITFTMLPPMHLVIHHLSL